MTKKVYRVRNWKEYNQNLVNRGSITLWFDEESIDQWHSSERSGGRGRPEEYSDTAILCGLTLRACFKLTYRATEGFVGSLIKMLGLEIRCPDYSLLCKRQRTLNIPQVVRSDDMKEPLHLVVDSTGLKVYGEGEWKVRQHGHSTRRTWRKLHLAINSKTHIIESFVLTDLGTQDCEAFPELVNKINGRIDSIAADGAYDRFSCYEEAEQKKFKLIAPPQHNARTSEERPRNKKKASSGAVQARDEVIKEVRKGRKDWKIKSNYHRRSLAETGVFRTKTLMGNKLTARTLERQRNEVALWCSLINKMTATGMPVTVTV